MREKVVINWLYKYHFSKTIYNGPIERKKNQLVNASNGLLNQMLNVMWLKTFNLWIKGKWGRVWVPNKTLGKILLVVVIFIFLSHPNFLRSIIS